MHAGKELSILKIVPRGQGSFSFLKSSSKIANLCCTESRHIKNGVEFPQKSIGAVRCSLALTYNH